MTIIEYDHGSFARDTNVALPNVYIPWGIDENDKVFYRGQDCGAVWYRTVAEARRALEDNDGIPPHGSQSGLCEQCRGRHPSQPDLPNFACQEWKERTAHGEKPLAGTSPV